MSGTSRRDQRRFLILGGVIFSALLLFLFSAHDRIPVPKPSSLWNGSKESQNEVPVVEPPVPIVEDEDDLDDIPTTHPSVNVLKPLPGALAPVGGETTIPRVLANLSSTEKVNAWVHGFSIFDKLYVKNGMFYVVTSARNDFPPNEHILTGSMVHGDDSEPETDASEIIQFISPAQAKDILGDFATVIPGVTMFIADPPQFLSHYYHFWGEVIMGAWRVYSTLALSKDKTLLEKLPFPNRWIFPFVEVAAGWRDPAGLNAPLMRLAFPLSSISMSGIWEDWAQLGTTFVFERSMIVNRKAAHKSPLGSVFFKMISGTEAITVPAQYWEPIRKAFSKSLFGFSPEVGTDGKPRVVPKYTVDPSTNSLKLEAQKGNRKPIVTYISRQSTGRRLLTPDHEGLVAALRQLEKDGICEVRIPVMEKLTLAEQMAEVASSTIIVGVHGNGLTHQIFMPPSLRSAVFEVQPPGDWANDYWMLAHNVGHKHYMVRNDTLTTFPPDQHHQGVHYSDLFHSSKIPAYGPVVADEIRKRLTQPASKVEP